MVNTTHHLTRHLNGAPRPLERGYPMREGCVTVDLQNFEVVPRVDPRVAHPPKALCSQSEVLVGEENTPDSIHSNLYVVNDRPPTPWTERAMASPCNTDSLTDILLDWEATDELVTRDPFTWQLNLLESDEDVFLPDPEPLFGKLETKDSVEQGGKAQVVGMEPMYAADGEMPGVWLELREPVDILAETIRAVNLWL